MTRNDPRYQFDGLCLYRPIVDATANAIWVGKMGTGGVLLDLGGNIAEVALRCRGQFDRIVCVEANPRTCDIARRRIAAAGARNITVVNRAVAPDDAPKKYWVSNPSPGSIGATARRDKRLSGRADDYYLRVATVPLSALLARYAPRCVKMDIERGEFEVLAVDQVAAYDGLAGVEFLLVEFHGRRDPRTAAIVDRIVRRGFKVANPEELDSRTTWEAMTLMFVRRGRRRWQTAAGRD